jgi:hypothetical protein
MKTLKIWALALVLIGGLSACGKAPTVEAAAAMKAGDLAKAESLLDAAFAEKPEQKDVWALRFVLYRHLAVRGAADKQQAYVGKAVVEYDRLAQALGLKPDYADMEGSLRGNSEGAALILAARRPLYGN